MRKTISDVALVTGLAATPNKSLLRSKANFEKMLSLSARSLQTMYYDNKKVAEFVDKFIETPHGDTLKAIVEKLQDSAPSRTAKINPALAFPTLGR